MSEAEIRAAAALAAKHAEERTLLAGRHENERRDLMRQQRTEAMGGRQQLSVATQVPAVPTGEAKRQTRTKTR